MAKNEVKKTTVLGAETHFNGVLNFTDELLIIGKFEGEIKSTGNVEIDKESVCTVNSITASSIVVCGKVTGDLYATEQVAMNAGSKIIGDVTTSRLKIDDNVDFHGQVKMLDKVVENDIFAFSSAEMRENLLSKKSDEQNEEDVKNDNV
ncbi:MAG: polymer-forming cytoskeletal protein [Spirochaetaceae bacterium]|nr:polymer-forming cytoskeletal protein [Spirochaetaceae bacterium]